MTKKPLSPPPKTPPLVRRSRRTSLTLGAVAFLTLGSACASDDGDSDDGESESEGDGGGTQEPPQVAPQAGTGGDFNDGTGGAGAPQVYPGGGIQDWGTGGAGAPQFNPSGGDYNVPPQPAPTGGDTFDESDGSGGDEPIPPQAPPAGGDAGL